MNQLSIKLGYWSALLSAATFIVFTICFVAIFIVNPLFTWTNLSDYVDAVHSSNQLFKFVAQSMMLLFAPLFVALLASIEEYAQPDKKILARIAIYFGVIFATLISVNYFAQLSIVRQNIAEGNLVGLEHLIMVNPGAAILAINMLGWTLFFGLSSLFVAPVFSGGRLEKVIRYAFLLNGIFCLLGGIGFVFGIPTLVFFTINLGMGAAVTVVTIALAMLFKRLDRQIP
jgi:hypothetical protein